MSSTSPAAAGAAARPSRPAPGSTRAVGDTGLLIECAGAWSAQALATHLRRASHPAVVDVVPGLRSVLVRFDHGFPGEPGDAVELNPWQLSAAGLLPGGQSVADALTVIGVAGSVSPRLIEVPTVFDGPDLAEVADQCRWSVTEVVEALAAAELWVEVLGFSPGFAYLGGLPDPLAQVPRRATPRSAVPAGSVALAGGFAAVYPQRTPGGWQLVGRTDLPLFDPTREPHTLFRPGDRVRFVPRDAQSADHPPAAVDTSPAAAAAPPPLPGRDCLVVDSAGMLTLLQDRGRRAVAHLGVPGAGPADAESHALANLLVGNEPGAAALEITARGPRLRALTDLHVALVGGSAELEVDGRRAPADAVVPVSAGQQLAVGPTVTALRAVLAIAGGLVGPPSWDSLSTDTLSWTGPPALQAGDVLRAAVRRAPLGGRLVAARAEASDPWVLRVLAGPHPEWFAADALELLAATTFVVEPQSDRVGLRLRATGESGVLRRHPGELESQPMVTGAVQVPPSGQPVVLGPDHATLGGYPVIAVVIAADLRLLGRCRPGDRVQFVVVDPDRAGQARRELRRTLSQAVVGHFPTEPAS